MVKCVVAKFTKEIGSLVLIYFMHQFKIKLCDLKCTSGFDWNQQFISIAVDIINYSII